MIVRIKDTLQANAVRQANIAEHCRRIEAEQPAAEQAEREEREQQRLEAKRIVTLAQKKKARRVLISHLAHWMQKIDHLNAMAANPGWSSGRG